MEVEPRVVHEGLHSVPSMSHGTSHAQGNKICEPVKGKCIVITVVVVKLLNKVELVISEFIVQ